MQYLLTADEYASLSAEANEGRERICKELQQQLCTDVANFKPIKRGWATEKLDSPWGCILNEKPLPNPVYCDCCPVKTLCPNKYKNWSK